MKIENKSKHAFQHSFMDDKQELQIIQIESGEIKDIPDDIAAKWLKSGEVIEYIEPENAKKLANENAELKKELEKLKTDNKTVTKKTSKKK